MSNEIGIAYIPVLHKGYLDFCVALQEKGVTTLYLVGDDMLAVHDELDYINRKDRLRAIPQKDIAVALRSIVSLDVEILDRAKALALTKEDIALVVPSEDISTFVADVYFKSHVVTCVPIFLRWNKENVGETNVPEAGRPVSLSVFESEVFKEVLEEAAKSFDWWRQVGAALVKDEEIIVVTHNEHMLEKQLPNILGDTRSLFKKGININYVTSAHAEVAAIGEAAKRGIPTEGASLFVTDFPCPYCARLIVKSGIKKIYFIQGYAVLDGDEFFKEAGIEVVKVTL